MTRGAVFLMLVGWGLIAAVERADAAGAMKDELSALFTEGWKPTFSDDVHASLADHYQKAKATAPADARPPLAYAIVQIRQQKYGDAFGLLDEVLKLDKANLPARRMKIWLLTVTKKHAPALVEMDAMTKLFPAATGDAAAEEQFASSAAFVGRIMAYLEGPGAGSVNDNQLLETKSKIWDRLSPSRREAFESGYKKVSGRFADLTKGKEKSRADAVAEEDKQKEQTKVKLESDKVQIEKDLATIDEKAAKIREEERRAVSELDAQLTPLVGQLADLDARARTIQSSIAVLQVNIANLLNQASAISNRREPKDRDEFQIALLIGEANRQQVILANDEAALRSVRVQAAEVNARYQSLLGRRQTAVHRAAAGLDALERQQAQLQGTQKRIGFDEQKLAKPSTGFTTKVTSLSATLAALKTYDELPLDQERQRILDSLAD